MKNTILIIGLIAIILIVILLVVINKVKNKNVYIGHVERFEFFYTQGYAMNADVRYKFNHKVKDNWYKISVKEYGVSEEDAKLIEVDEEFRDKLEAIIDKYKVKSWDGFNKSDKNVLDGDSFSLSIHYPSGSVSAHGYMSWPKNYRDFRNEIDELFGEIK